MARAAQVLTERLAAAQVADVQANVEGGQLVVTSSDPGQTDRIVQMAARGQVTIRPVVLTGPSEASAGATGTWPVAIGGPSAAAAQAAFVAVSCTTPPDASAALPDAQVLVTCSEDGAEKFILGPAPLTGPDIISAKAELDSGGGIQQWVVVVALDGPGAKTFARMTTTAAQQVQASDANRVAIAVDGVVLTAPAVNSAISNGQLQVTGNFTSSSAEELAALIGHGTLPVLLTRM